jgi:hypothetical protein
VTTLARLTGAFVMFAGVGIIGALASILASIVVPPPDEGRSDEDSGAVGRELSEVKAELAALRRALESRGIADP